jgi:hypothetical protein
MSDPLTPEPKNIKAPPNINNLRSRINQYAREHGLGVDRVQQRVFTEIIIGLLDRAEKQRAIPGYLIKGGMALELRFGMRARASGDLDVAFQGENALQRLDDALVVGFGDFTFERRPDTIYLENAKTHRVRVKILYMNRPLGTIDIDINQALEETSVETVTTSLITHFGLPGPLRVPIIDAHIHLAHKLHAATEPSRPDYMNQRYRDLIDALVLAREGNLDFVHMRAVAAAEFARREHHQIWPPLWRLSTDWRTPLEALAKEHGFDPSDPDLIEREIIALLERIEGIPIK